MTASSRKRPVSLQRRLGQGLTLWLALLWLTASVAAGFVVRDEMYDVFDSALQETAERIMPLATLEILNRDDASLVSAPQDIAPLNDAKEYLTYTVRDARGNVLLQSHEVTPDLFPARPEVGFHNAGDYRFYGASAVSNTLFIEVAEPLEHRRRALFETVMTLLLPLALVIPLSFLGIWFYVRRSLRHVVAYRDAIEARGEGDLTPVDSEGRLPAEVEPVAHAVNQLMDRLRRALEAERSFTANSAHELRTPVAEALAQVQRLRREAPDGPLQERAQHIESSLRNLTTLSEKLMQLAKAEGAGLLSRQPHDLVSALNYVLMDFQAHSERISLDLPDNGPVLSRFDQDAFAILVRNLIENALKHSPPDEPVEVRLTATELRVINGGPVVDADCLDTLTDRFIRGKTGALGSGLGLAIVRAIANGAHARLELRSPAAERADGFEVRVLLPTASSEHQD